MIGICLIAKLFPLLGLLLWTKLWHTYPRLPPPPVPPKHPTRPASRATAPSLASDPPRHHTCSFLCLEWPSFLISLSYSPDPLDSISSSGTHARLPSPVELPMTSSRYTLYNTVQVTVNSASQFLAEHSLPKGSDVSGQSRETRAHWFLCLLTPQYRFMLLFPSLDSTQLSRRTIICMWRTVQLSIFTFLS